LRASIRTAATRACARRGASSMPARSRTEAASAGAAVFPERSHRVSVVRGVCGSALPVLFHTGHSGIGTGCRAAAASG
jgi:hypothetical protein